MHLYLFGSHADRRRRLQQGIGKPVNKGGEGETPEFVKIGRFDPAARTWNGASHRPWPGAASDTGPSQVASRRAITSRRSVVSKAGGMSHTSSTHVTRSPVAESTTRCPSRRAGSSPIAALST